MDLKSVGELVLYDGRPCVRLYDDPKLAFALLKSPGHGYFSQGDKVIQHMAWASEYALVAVEKEAVKENDLGQVITRERLREMAEQVGAAAGAGSVLRTNSRVHWCRVCGPCNCYKRRKEVIL